MNIYKVILVNDTGNFAGYISGENHSSPVTQIVLCLNT